MKHVLLTILVAFAALQLHGQYTSYFSEPMGIIDDGSWDQDYVPPIDNIYVIQPTGVTQVEVTFSDFDVNPGGDWVYVYDGNSINAPLIGAYHFYQLPPPVIRASGGSICIRFVATQGGSRGWTLQWPARVQESYSFIDPDGTFEDGSEHFYDYYFANVNNTYLIKPAGYSKVELTFDQFDVDYFYDTLYVYDGEDASARLVGAYNNDILPPSTITSTGNSLFLKFVTNGDYQLYGWWVSYRGIDNQVATITYDYDAAGNRTDRNISVQIINTTTTKSSPKGYIPMRRPHRNSKNPEDNKMAVYPNPTKGELQVALQGVEKEAKKSIALYSLSGHLLISKTPSSYITPLDITQYPAGTYILKVVLGDNTTEWKIVKE